MFDLDRYILQMILIK